MNRQHGGCSVVTRFAFGFGMSRALRGLGWGWGFGAFPRDPDFADSW